MILVGGPVTPDAVGAMKLRDKVVLYVHDYSTTIPTNATQVARAIRLSGARAIIAISNLDSAAFAARVPKYGAGALRHRAPAPARRRRSR